MGLLGSKLVMQVGVIVNGPRPALGLGGFLKFELKSRRAPSSRGNDVIDSRTAVRVEMENNSIHGEHSHLEEMESDDFIGNGGREEERKVDMGGERFRGAQNRKLRALETWPGEAGEEPFVWAIQRRTGEEELARGLTIGQLKVSIKWF